MPCGTRAGRSSTRCTARRALACVIALLTVGGLSIARDRAQAGWRSFHSDLGFSVSYPSNWIGPAAMTDGLTLINIAGGLTGMIVKRDQAKIFVIEDTKHLYSALSDLEDRYQRGADVLSRQRVRNDAAGPLGCRVLEEVRLRQAVVLPEAVPGGHVPYYRHTEYFCAINGRKFMTQLTYYEGDKSAILYSATARRIAESLRVDK